MVNFYSLPVDVIYEILQTIFATSSEDAINLSQVNKNVRAVSIPVIFRAISLFCGSVIRSDSDIIHDSERYDVAAIHGNVRIFSCIRKFKLYMRSPGTIYCGPRTGRRSLIKESSLNSSNAAPSQNPPPGASLDAIATLILALPNLETLRLNIPPKERKLILEKYEEMHKAKKGPLFPTLSRLHLEDMEWVPFLNYCPNVRELSLNSWNLQGLDTKDGWLKELSKVAALATNVVRLRLNAFMRDYLLDAIATIFPAVEDLELNSYCPQEHILRAIPFFWKLPRLRCLSLPDVTNQSMRNHMQWVLLSPAHPEIAPMESPEKMLQQVLRAIEGQFATHVDSSISKIKIRHHGSDKYDLYKLNERGRLFQVAAGLESADDSHCFGII